MIVGNQVLSELCYPTGQYNLPNGIVLSYNNNILLSTNQFFINIWRQSFSVDMI